MRITKSDVDAFPRFAAVPKGMFVVDSLCFFSGENIEILCDALNYEYAAYYFLRNVAILDNGGIQMRQQYVEEIPLPQKLFEEKNIMKSFKLTDKEISFIRDYVSVCKKDILENQA